MCFLSKLMFMFASLLVCVTFLFAQQPSVAGPHENSKLLSTPPVAVSNTERTTGKTARVWKVKQSNSWGHYTIYAANNVLRIDGSTGGSLIAKAPEWKVIVFHPEDRRMCSTPYSQWGAGRVTNSFNVERSGAKATGCTVAGIKALRYSFDLNREIEQEDGGIFRSTSKVQLLRTHLTIASDNHGLPKQAIEIWRRLFELQCKDAIPLEAFSDKRFGGTTFAFRTLSQSTETVPLKFFDCPVGFKEGGTPLSVFFGSCMEDAASLMLDMK